LLALLGLSLNANSQVKESNLKAVFIYQLAQYITWQDEASIKAYKIGLLTNDSMVVDNFRIIASTSKLKKKPMIPIPLQARSSFSDCQILFIDEYYRNKTATIAEQIKNQNTLLITYNSDNRLFFMINLFRNTMNRSIQFEVNSENMQNARLQYAPDIMLLGGSLVDLKFLYKQTLEQLSVQEERYLALNEEIENLSQEKQRFIQQNDSILHEVKRLSSEMNQKTLESDSLNQQIKQRNKHLQNRTAELASQNTELKLLEQEYAKQITAIEESQTHLAKLNEEILKKEKLLNTQETTIITQSDTIENQQRLLLIVLALTLAALAAIVTTYSALRLRKRLNRKLIESNAQLASQKAEIEQTLLQLKATQQQLVESEKMASLGMLTAGMAHEINNPINFISGGSQALRLIVDDFIDVLSELQKINTENADVSSLVREKLMEFMQENNIDEIKALLNGIDQGVDRTIAIIQSLNAYSYNSEQHFQPYSITKAIDNALTILHSKYKHTIQIDKEIIDEAVVDCYPGKLNQAFVNVLSNAIQAINNEGRIHIQVEKVNDEVITRIHDNGEGMKPESIKRAFDPFYTTKQVGEGTGLGLYITYSIIQQHKGKIRIHSEPGKGTTVKIILPLQQEHEPQKVE
jgi:signal transduction histidine kinase